MFVNASAIVAILAQEPEHEAIIQKLEAATVKLTSPLAKYEAVLAISRIFRPPSIAATQFTVEQFFDVYEVLTVDITSGMGNDAIVAFEQFGKGRHKARLNMGDCFAYACAKFHNVPILCTGNDFIHTDIRIA